MTYQKKVLNNGLRIIAVSMKGAPSVTVMAFVEAGSKYETKATNGISHFLEHMCFKATEHRPNSIDISKEFDEIGSVHNAYTDHEHTCYYAKAHPKHLDKMLDIISDMYIHPTFPQSEIEIEKGVIIEEINMYEDMPDKIVQEEFQSLLYGDTPAGWRIIGPKENINSFSRSDFVSYRDKHYVAQATAVVVAGDVDAEDVFRKVEKLFSSLSESGKTPKERVINKQSEPKIRVKYKDTDQTHIVIGTRAFDRYNAKTRIVRLLSAVIGQGMSSRLFQKMRNELGICYYVYAGTERFTDHGYFYIAAGVDKNRVDLGIEGILEEMKKIRDEKVSDSELRKAKDFSIGHLNLSLESSDSLASFYGVQEIFKDEIKSPQEIEMDIEAISAEDIQSVASEIMRNEILNLAVVGKYNEEEGEKFRKILIL